MIHLDAEIVVAGGAVALRDEIVRRSGEVGLRKESGHFQGHRVQAVQRDLVVRERGLRQGVGDPERLPKRIHGSGEIPP